MKLRIYEDEDFYDPEDDMDFSDFDTYDDEKSLAFAEDMFDFLTDIIKQGEDVNEMFTSDDNFKAHFRKHCLGKSTNKRSTRKRVYYDFTDNSQYSDYEKKITSKIQNTDLIIDSLDDYDTVIEYMKKLFEGDCTVTFTKSCGLKDSKGHVSLSFSSYSSNVTDNYGNRNGGNTVDVCIKGKGNNTVTLYPVDAHSVQSRLNNIIKNDTDDGIERKFIFNND